MRLTTIFMIFTVIDNNNHQRQATLSIAHIEFDGLLKAAANKLRIKKATDIYDAAGEPVRKNFPSRLFIACSEQKFAAVPVRATQVPITMLANAAEVSLEAIQQLEAVARLPGVVAVHAMPDIHEGPNGCCISTEKCIYPYLIGSDIGCGVSVFIADKSLLKHNRTVESVQIQSEWLQKVRDLTGIKPSRFDDQLGSIGKGNHFAEICKVKQIQDERVATRLGIDADSILLLVHSGSRSFGKDVFEQTTKKCLQENTPDFEEFMKLHDDAGKWARANRFLIAIRVIGRVVTPIIDVSHNFVAQLDGKYLCRKGAAPTDQGPILLPGSRGTSSFILHPRVTSSATGFSSAHGCGRRLSRNEARAKAAKRNYIDSSTVIGSTNSILDEEIPEAYKAVNDVLQDTLPYADVVAELTPVTTIKS